MNVNVCVLWVNMCVLWVNVCVLWVNVCAKWVNVGECVRLVSSIMSIVYCNLITVFLKLAMYDLLFIGVCVSKASKVLSWGLMNGPFFISLYLAVISI